MNSVIKNLMAPLILVYYNCDIVITVKVTILDNKILHNLFVIAGNPL